MPPKWDTAVWYTAVHEASHAVAAYVFRKPVTLVSVRREGMSRGRTRILDQEDWGAIDDGVRLDPRVRKKIAKRQRRTMVILIAGDVGNRIDQGPSRKLVSERVPKDFYERIMAGEDVKTVAVQEYSDVHRALSLSLELPNEGMEEILTAEERAGRILRGRWKWVMRLAQKLMRREEITGAEITAPFK